MRRIAFLASLAIVGFLAAFVFTKMNQGDGLPQLAAAKKPAANSVEISPPETAPAGMVWIPPGEFLMGSDDPTTSSIEHPAHRVRIDGFWMDATEVTNDEFAKFVAATQYRTTAERPIDWEQLKKELPPGTPKPSDDKLLPGSLVFSPPEQMVPLDNQASWWKWVTGANWRSPDGPGSGTDVSGNHPVVQVSWDDATAFADWSGKRLPTEAEWEFAARGGLEGQKYAWGDELQPGGKFLANTWQGRFPDNNLCSDRFSRTAPVKSFPPNGYGLYDMIGNVWEWCHDWYRADAYRAAPQGNLVENPFGPASSFDPDEPFQAKRVTRGGSFLCSPNYCSNYRPSARRGTAFDSGMSHLGFRCALTPRGKK